jgi:hypothetical protein
LAGTVKVSHPWYEDVQRKSGRRNSAPLRHDLGNTN